MYIVKSTVACLGEDLTEKRLIQPSTLGVLVGLRSGGNLRGLGWGSLWGWSRQKLGMDVGNSLSRRGRGTGAVNERFDDDDDAQGCLFLG